MEEANTLTYYNTVSVTGAISFIVQTPGTGRFFDQKLKLSYYFRT